MRNGGKDIGAVGGGALDAISVIDAALSCLVIDVEVLKVVIEVDRAGAEVSAKKSGVGGEDGGYVYVALAAEGNGKACLPLVEVRDDCLVELAGNVLRVEKCESINVWRRMHGGGDGEWRFVRWSGGTRARFAPLIVTEHENARAVHVRRLSGRE